MITLLQLVQTSVNIGGGVHEEKILAEDTTRNVIVDAVISVLLVSD
jgi:hypothetical protein